MTFGSSTLVKEQFAEVQNVSPFGFWIYDGVNEFFISFKEYPDFLKCSIKEITDFSVDICGNFHWENLDIDIEKESLVNPEKYPLQYKA